MACVNPQNPDCPNCNKSGLAILPTRYAVVPNSIKATLPAPLGNKVTDVKLAHHHYALRTLRQGFIYLYYEKHARNPAIKWEVYSVAPDGMLYKQLSSNAIHPATNTMEQVCARNGDNYPASIIAIEKPEKCGKVWMAFSEHAWSAETFKQFASDAKLRDRRMQSFAPAELASTGKHAHAIEATESNTKQIIEYKDDFKPLSLDDPMPKTISNLVIHPTKQDPNAKLQTNGEFSSAVLNSANTIHHLHIRHQQSKKTVETMQKISERMNGEPYKPVIFALWDEMGITHELNGFRNETAGYIDQYENERALQISAFNAINNLRASIEDRAEARAKQHISMFKWTKQDSARYLSDTRPPLGHIASEAEYDANRKRLCQLWEEDAKKGADTTWAHGRSQHLRLSTADFNKKMAEITAHIDKNLVETKKTIAERKKLHFDREWAIYKNNVDWDAYNTFKSKYFAFQAQSTQLVDQRTDDLLAWLKAPAFRDMLTEFHQNSLNDGIAFEDKIGTAIFGINSSPKGGAQIDAWVKELEASEPNLLWRAISRNQKAAMQELSQTLKQAEAAKSIAADAYAWADYGKTTLASFAGIYNSERSAPQNASSPRKAGTIATTTQGMALDKIMVTSGDRILKHFKAVDKASEYIIQHVLAIRAFVDPADSIALVSERAKYEKLSRNQQLRRLYAAQAFMAADTPPVNTQQTESLKKAWQDFSKKTTAGQSAVKDARLAVLLMLIEGLNFSHMLANPEFKGDAKTAMALSASAMTITSGLFEVASAPAKVLMGEHSYTYNKIKLAGGVLSCFATAIGAWIDYDEYQSKIAKGQTGVAYLYFGKALLGFVSAGLTGASSLSNASPMLARMLGEGAISAGAKKIGERAAAMLAARILFMSAGSWITVGIFALQIIIWKVSDDELESWLSLCALGNDRLSDDAYQSATNQNNALINARGAVGI